MMEVILMSKMSESKEKIIRATMEIAATMGFANTKTSEIARQAGVSEALIFKYFPTKSQLFALVVHQAIEHLKSGIVRVLEDTELSATAKVSALVDFHFRFFTDKFNLAQILIGISDRTSLGFHIQPIIEEGLHPYGQLIIKVLKEGMEAGEFRPLNPEITATAIIASMQVNLVNQIFSSKPLNLEQVKQEVNTFILSAILAPKETHIT